MADAVVVEPVSASQFPANREKNRELFVFTQNRRSELHRSHGIYGLPSKIPYLAEQGISEEKQGKIEQEQGISEPCRPKG